VSFLKKKKTPSTNNRKKIKNPHSSEVQRFFTFRASSPFGSHLKQREVEEIQPV
jgi:hypothetical protein